MAPDAGDEVVDRLASGGRATVVCWSPARAAAWCASGTPATPGDLAGITLDSGLDGVWVVRDGDAVAALTGDGQLHIMDLRSAP